MYMATDKTFCVEIEIKTITDDNNFPSNNQHHTQHNLQYR